MATILRITGIVQGVGYRAGFARMAHAQQLSGWVRNRADGSVEACIAGAADAVDAMIAWARHGPPGAQVRGVAIAEADDAPVSGGGFEILATV